MVCRSSKQTRSLQGGHVAILQLATDAGSLGGAWRGEVSQFTSQLRRGRSRGVDSWRGGDAVTVHQSVFVPHGVHATSGSGVRHCLAVDVHLVLVLPLTCVK